MSERAPARGDDLVALRVERHLRDFAFVAYEDRLACAGHRVVDSRGPVCRSRNQPRPSRVESDVQDLIIVPAQGANALPRLHVPNFAGAIN